MFLGLVIRLNVSNGRANGFQEDANL